MSTSKLKELEQKLEKATKEKTKALIEWVIIRSRMHPEDFLEKITDEAMKLYDGKREETKL